MDFERLLLTGSEHWKAFLHESQCYLGRFYVWANDDSSKDLLEITDDEVDDFLGISRKVKDALCGLFHPDKFNYASLGNVADHLHVHVIPRYMKPRVFDGRGFVDRRWGENYAPYDKEFRIPEETLFKIRDVIRGKLK